MSAVQLPLALKLDTDATFDSYYCPESHQLAVHQLRAMTAAAGERFIYLCGNSGKSHLLQACCHLAQTQGRHARYIPLADMLEFEPEAVLEGCEQLDLLCLDDLDQVLPSQKWEHALFNSYNRMLPLSCKVLVSSSKALSQHSFSLADLRSRMQNFSTYLLQEMSDEERIAALQLRASLRGMNIPGAVAEFIYLRYQRDLTSLITMLNELDRRSLAAQRKVTIPFVKEVMGW